MRREIDPKIISIILMMWLTQYLNERSSIGNFYGNFPREIYAKIAARNTTEPVTTESSRNIRFIPSHSKNKPLAFPSHPGEETQIVEIKFTAYYGPEKNQKKFFNGNFKKEVQMNGKGKLTAYGTKPRLGIVATDPEVFPRGTRFLLVDPLDGQEKVFVAEDTGGGIKGHHLDFFVGWGKNGYERVKKVQSAGNTLIVKVLNPPT